MFRIFMQKESKLHTKSFQFPKKLTYVAEEIIGCNGSSPLWRMGRVAKYIYPKNLDQKIYFLLKPLESSIEILFFYWEHYKTMSSGLPRGLLAAPALGSCAIV